MLCFFYCCSPFLLIISFQSLVLWLFSIGYSLTNKQKTAVFDDFRLFLAFFGDFLLSSPKWLKIINSSFSGTLVHSNIFRLWLIRAFCDAWFAQNNFLTEVILAISAVHFSFATIFQYFKFVRFCSYSKLELCYRCSLQWWKSFVDIFFHHREISKQTLGIIKKKGLILSSESVNMLIRGVVAAVRVVKDHSKSTPTVFFLYS